MLSFDILSNQGEREYNEDSAGIERHGQAY